MKILIIHPYSFSEYKGGVESHCQNLEKYLSQYVKIYQINGSYFKFFGEPLPKIRIFQTIRYLNPDIVHLQGPRPFATLTGIFSKILGKKTILTYHAHLNPQNRLKKAIIILDKFFLKYIFDFCIVNSKKYQKEVGKFFPKSKIKVIPPIIEDHFFQYSKTKEECKKELSLDKEKTVLFVGKLDSHHYYKGIDILIKATKLLPEKIKIILVGNGDKKADYERMALDSGVTDKIRFAGEVSQEDLMKYYCASDVFVLPSTSDSEGFGLVLLEAMAMGLPVITTNVVGSARMIEEKKAGILIPPNDPAALSKAIQELLKDKSLYKILKESGKKFAEEFRIQKNINKFLEVYKSLLV